MSHPEIEEESWDHSRRSSHCHLCAPREPNNEDRLEIASLSISTLYLFWDQRFRGYSLLTFDRRHATALEELSAEEYNAFMHDLSQAGTAIRSALNPDHMNYECLGNSSPHLHCHMIPRYIEDPRWGQPIWGGWPRNEFSIRRFTLSDAEYTDLIQRIRTRLVSLRR